MVRTVIKAQRLGQTVIRSSITTDIFSGLCITCNTVLSQMYHDLLLHSTVCSYCQHMLVFAQQNNMHKTFFYQVAVLYNISMMAATSNWPLQYFF